MTKAVNPVPEGYHTVTPYFTVADAGGCDTKELTKGIAGHETPLSEWGNG